MDAAEEGVTGGRPRSPEAVEAAALALAAGATVEDAARQAGVSVRTLKSWRKSPRFRAKVAQLRDDMTKEATGRLSRTCTAASDKLAKLVDSGDEKVSLQASKAIIELTLKCREQLELADRLEALERRLGQDK